MLTQSYEVQEQKWRTNYAQALRAERGWLSVAGLFWLPIGETTIGSSSDSGVVLPARLHRSIGTLVRTEDGVTLKVGGKPERKLQPDKDLTRVEDVSFMVIQRGKRVGVRVYDPKSEAQLAFKGLHWYPVSSKFSVEATYTVYPVPKVLKIVNVLGDTTEVPGPGYVEFTLDGKTQRLEVQEEGDGLFLNFQDETSGKETYGAGRFLSTNKPFHGHVTIDFNRATNPPCAYTAFATCPLPPPGNRLTVPIPAGEKNFHN